MSYTAVQNPKIFFVEFMLKSGKLGVPEYN